MLSGYDWFAAQISPHRRNILEKATENGNTRYTNKLTPGLIQSLLKQSLVSMLYLFCYSHT